jgi:hypothetical protein
MPQGKTITVPDDDVLVHDSNEDSRPRRTAAAMVDDIGFSDLKEQLDRAQKERDDERKARDEERRGREAAEGRARQSQVDADQARKDAEDARTEGAEGQRLAIGNAIKAKKQSLDSLEAELATAMEAGDFKKVSAAQRRMSEEAAELKNLEAGMVALGEEPETRRATGRVDRADDDARTEPRRKEKTGDPFEDYIGQFSSGVQDWLRRHRECVTNKTKNSQVIAAHHEAQDKGYRLESDAYWAYIERKMGYKDDAARRAVAADNRDGDDPDGDHDDQDRDDGRQQQRGGNRMPSARVSRGNGGGRSSDVYLTEGEVLAATDGTLVWNTGNIFKGRVLDPDPRTNPNGWKADQAVVGSPIGEYEMARRKKNMKADGRYVVPMME